MKIVRCVLFVISLLICETLIVVGAGGILIKFGFFNPMVNMIISVFVGTLSLLTLLTTSALKDFIDSKESNPAAESDEKDEPVKKFKR